MPNISATRKQQTLPFERAYETANTCQSFENADLTQSASQTQLFSRVIQADHSMRLVPGKGVKLLCAEKQLEPLKNYAISTALGSGANGNVRYCEKKSQGYAMKTGTHNADENRFRGFLNEAIMHIKMTDNLPEHTTPLYKVFLTQDKFYFIMAEGPQNLQKLAKAGAIKPQAVPAIILQAHALLTDMQAIGIDHNDVKLANFLGTPMESGWTLKVIDFGAASPSSAQALKVSDDALLLFKELLNELTFVSMRHNSPFGETEKSSLALLKQISRQSSLGNTDWLQKIRNFESAKANETDS